MEGLGIEIRKALSSPDSVSSVSSVVKKTLVRALHRAVRGARQLR
jgi:hypothetical protein